MDRRMLLNALDAPNLPYDPLRQRDANASTPPGSCWRHTRGDRASPLTTQSLSTMPEVADHIPAPARASPAASMTSLSTTH